MKPVNVKPGNYNGLNKENNKEESKFEDVNHVRIWRCKNIFAKHYVPNWLEQGKKHCPIDTCY